MPEVQHARAMHGSIVLLVLPLTSAVTAAEAWSCSRAGLTIIRTEAGGEVPLAKHIPRVSNLSLNLVSLLLTPDHAKGRETQITADNIV
jgi:hypothetical protein